MKILIMGLPGSGKTHLAEQLQRHLKCAWFNADKVREMANDWNFDSNARIRQAKRMRNIADYESQQGKTVICDFICPTMETREAFRADLTIFMDTIKQGRFENTNRIFERPDPKVVTLWIYEFIDSDGIEELAYWLQENYNV